MIISEISVIRAYMESSFLFHLKLVHGRIVACINVRREAKSYWLPAGQSDTLLITIRDATVYIEGHCFLLLDSKLDRKVKR